MGDLGIGIELAMHETSMVTQLLEQYAKRCTKSASECSNPKVERVLRLLAMDLMFAARRQGIRIEHSERKSPKDRLRRLASLVEVNKEKP